MAIMPANSFNPIPFYIINRRTRNCHWILNDKIDYYSFCVYPEGGAEYELNGVHYELRAGDMLLCPPGTERKAKTSGFKESDVDFFAEKIDGLTKPVIVHGKRFEQINLYMDRINHLYLSGPGSNMAAIRGYLLIIISEFISCLNGGLNKYVEKMREYLIENYTRGVTMRDLSRITGITPAYCGTLFKHEMGCTVTEYINKLRIDTAIRYMSDDDAATLEEIADSVGFCDEYQFSKIFKRTIGESPGEYRRKL